MSTPDTRDLDRLEALAQLLQQAAHTPIGDLLASALEILEQIEIPMHQLVAEEAMRRIRSLASRAQPDDRLFENPPQLPRKLSDLEVLQLLSIQGATHELCYCCEMVQTATDLTWGGSTPTRFYLNSIYHYTSSMFLVDTSKPTHKGLPMGGTVVRALHPMGLSHLLQPINEILDERFGDTTFGDTILNLRHSHLVHGDFSPVRIEYLVRETQMRNPMQQERFAQLVWKLFHRLVILNLQLLSLLASTGEDLASVAIRYVQSQEAGGIAGPHPRAPEN